MTQPQSLSLEDLCAEIRKSASTDVEFAHRVALACVALVKMKKDAVAAMETTFRIR